MEYTSRVTRIASNNQKRQETRYDEVLPQRTVIPQLPPSPQMEDRNIQYYINRMLSDGIDEFSDVFVIRQKPRDTIETPPISKLDSITLSRTARHHEEWFLVKNNLALIAHTLRDIMLLDGDADSGAIGSLSVGEYLNRMASTFPLTPFKNTQNENKSSRAMYNNNDINRYIRGQKRPRSESESSGTDSYDTSIESHEDNRCNNKKSSKSSDQINALALYIAASYRKYNSINMHNNSNIAHSYCGYVTDNGGINNSLFNKCNGNMMMGFDLCGCISMDEAISTAYDKCLESLRLLGVFSFYDEAGPCTAHSNTTSSSLTAEQYDTIIKETCYKVIKQIYHSAWVLYYGLLQWLLYETRIFDKKQRGSELKDESESHNKHGDDVNFGILSMDLFSPRNMRLLKSRYYNYPKAKKSDFNRLNHGNGDDINNDQTITALDEKQQNRQKLRVDFRQHLEATLLSTNTSYFDSNNTDNSNSSIITSSEKYKSDGRTKQRYSLISPRLIALVRRELYGPVTINTPKKITKIIDLEEISRSNNTGLYLAIRVAYVSVMDMIFQNKLENKTEILCEDTDVRHINPKKSKGRIATNITKTLNLSQAVMNSVLRTSLKSNKDKVYIDGKRRKKTGKKRHVDKSAQMNFEVHAKEDHCVLGVDDEKYITHDSNKQ